MRHKSALSDTHWLDIADVSPMLEAGDISEAPRPLAEIDDARETFCRDVKLSLVPKMSWETDITNETAKAMLDACTEEARGASYDNSVVALPVCIPTVRKDFTVPTTPIITWLTTNVSEIQAVASQAESPTRSMPD